MPNLLLPPQPSQQELDLQGGGIPQNVTEQKEFAEADAFAQHSFIQAKTTFDKQLKSFQDQPPTLEIPTPTTKETLEQFDDFATTALAEAPDDRSRNYLGFNLTKYREGYANRLIETEAKLDIQKKKQRAIETVSSSKERLLSDPRLLLEALDDVDLMTSYLPAGQMEEFASNSKKDLATTTLKSLAKDDPESAAAELMGVEGLYAADEFEEISKSIEIAQRQKQVEKIQTEENAVNSFDALNQKVETGDFITDDEFDAVTVQMSKLENPEISATFRENKMVLKEKQRLRTLSADELEGAKGDVNPEVRKYAKKMQAMAKKTPLEYELKLGNVTFEPVDLGEYGSLVSRKGDALFAAKRHNTEPQFLTSQEASQMTQKIIDGTSDDLIHFADQLKSGFGEYSNNVLSEIEKTAPVEAHVMGMMMDDNASSAFAKDAIQGQKLFRERPDLKKIYFGEDMERPDNTFKNIAGEAFASAEGAAVAIQETANAIYASQVQKTGRTQFDEKIYSEAMRRAAGGTDDPRTGIRPINGKKTILPGGVTDDDFENYINNFLPEDMVDHATFEYVGPDSYRVMVFGEDITGGTPIELSKEIIDISLDTVGFQAEQEGF